MHINQCNHSFPILLRGGVGPNRKPPSQGLCLIALFVSQEYLPRIKDNDVLRAVEKNSSGSRPKELFEEVLEEVDKQWEADR